MGLRTCCCPCWLSNVQCFSLLSSSRCRAAALLQCNQEMPYIVTANVSCLSAKQQCCCSAFKKHPSSPQQLSLRHRCRFGDAGLEALGTLTTLCQLNLNECWQITAAGVNALSRAPCSVAFRLHCGCAPASAALCLQLTGITDAMLAEIWTHPQSSQLLPQWAPVAHICLILALHAGLTLLRELSLAGCRNISGQGQAALEGLKPLKQLEALHLRNCDGLQDGSLDCFTALQRLASLDLSGCQQLSGRG